MGKLEQIDAAGGVAIAHIFPHVGHISKEQRGPLAGQRAATLWLTGLSGAGKSTLAYALERRLLAEGHLSCVLDGDNMRHHLNGDLGFTPRDRQENIRRGAVVARLMNDAGMMVICAFISPLRSDREMARQIIGADNFIETYVSTPSALCEERDPKGLYKKARAGLIPAFTGVSAPYEAPLAPALTLDTATLSLEQSCERLFQQLCPRFI
ncbi:adenylyl-sulfate kinase [Janthinobacterium sp. MDT1-19]|uniref:adenylyl-sulfate kinase n=1 Tax=Janthinobacterium sp. MDT1-19 TaxID=1259339 RepID=UPI003F22BF99